MHEKFFLFILFIFLKKYTDQKTDLAFRKKITFFDSACLENFSWMFFFACETSLGLGTRLDRNRNKLCFPMDSVFRIQERAQPTKSQGDQK